MLSKYGLNALAELCTPPKIRFRENALEALYIDDGAIINSLTTLASKIKPDQHAEQAEAIATILRAIFQGCTEYSQLNAEALLANTSIAKLLSALAASGIHTESFAAPLVHSVDQAANGGLISREEAEPIATGIALSLKEGSKNGTISLETQSIAAMALCGIGARNTAVVPKLAASGVTEIVCGYVEKMNYKDKSEIFKAETCLKFLNTAFSEYTRDNAEVSEKTEFYKKLVPAVDCTNKKISQLASKAAAALFGDADFFKALEVISDEKADSAERIQSYAVLGALAGDPSYAQKIVDNGGIPKLLAAVENSANAISGGQNREDELDGLNAVTNLLTRIAQGGEDVVRAMLDNGILDTLDGALSAIDLTADGDVATRLAGVLAAVCANEETAQEAESRGLVAKMLSLIKENCANEDFSHGALEFVNQLSQYPSLIGALIDGSAFETLIFASQYHLDNDRYQQNCLEALEHLSHSVADASYADFNSFAISLRAACGDPRLLNLAFGMLWNVSASSGAQEALGLQSLIEAICLGVYTSDDAGCKQTGREILETVANSDILYSIASSGRLSNWQKDQIDAMQKISACAVLSSIPGLATADTADACTNLLVGVDVGMLGSPDVQYPVSAVQSVFSATDGGTSIYTAAVRALGTVLSSAPASVVDARVHEVAQLAMNSSLAKQVISNPAQETVVAETIAGLKKILESGKVESPEAMASVVQACSKLASTFEDFKQVSLATQEAIEGILRGSGAQQALENNGPVTIVNFTKKSRFTQKPLIQGMRNIRLQIVNIPEKQSAIDAFKREGTLQVILAALRANATHTDIKEEAGRVIPLLMDGAEAEAAAASLVQRLNAAFDAKNEDDMVNVLVEAGGLCTSPHVARAFGRLGGAEILASVANSRETYGSKRGEIITETLGVMSALAPTIGAKLKQLNMYETASWLYQTEYGAGNPAALATGALACRLLFGSENDATITETYSLVPTCCAAMRDYPEEPGVVEQSGRLLKMLASDPNTKHLAAGAEMRKLLVDAAAKLNDAANKSAAERAPLLGLLAGGLGGHDPGLASAVLGVIELKHLNSLIESAPKSQAAMSEGILAMDILDGLGAAGAELRDGWESQIEDEEVFTTTVTTVLEMLSDPEVGDNPDKVATILSGFNALVRQGKDTETKRLAMSPVVSALINRYENSHAGVRQAANALFNSLPPVGAELAGFIRAAINAHNGGDITTMNRNLMLIVTSLRAPISTPDEAFVDLNELLAVFNAMPTESNMDKNALGMAGSIMHQLANKYDNSADYGYANLLAQGCTDNYLLPLTAKQIGSLATRGPSVKAASEVMTRMAKDTDWRETFLESHASNPLDLSLLDDFEREPDVRQAVVNLLDAILGGPPSQWVDQLFQDEKFSAKVTEILGQEAKSGKGDIDKLTRLLEGIARSGNVSGSVLQNLINCSTYLCDLLEQVDNMGAETGANVINLADAIMEIDNKLLKDKGFAMLDAVGRRLAGMDDNNDVCKGRYFVKVKELIQVGDLPEVLIALLKPAGDLIEPTSDPSSIIAAINAGLQNQETRPEVLKLIEEQQIEMKLLGGEDTSVPPPVFATTEVLNEFLRMMNDLMDDPITKTKLIMNDALLEKLSQVDASGVLDAESEQLLQDMENKLAEVLTEDGDLVSVSFRNGQVKKNLDLKHLEGAPVDTEELTVRKIYGYLKELLINEKEISPFKDPDNSNLMYWFEFTWTKMNEYSADERLHKELFRGDEVKWGCLCWELWLENDYDLCDTILEWTAHDSILIQNLILCQETDVRKDVDLMTNASIALAAVALKTSPGGRAAADIEGIEQALTDNLSTGLGDNVVGNRQDHIIPRLKCIERVAVDRNVFPSPDIVDWFVECWDRYDAGTYGNPLLRQLYRAMRRSLHPKHINKVREYGLCERLLGELRKNKDNTVLIDGFFLLGILAGFPVCRDLIGKAGGVEISLTVLRDHLSDAPSVGVVTNVLSALGNIVLDHRANDDQFVKLEGLKTVVWVLNNRSSNYPEINAAAALIANSSYRRDDVKALYGSAQVGGPAALSSAISKYDGTDSDAAYRALAALFKAIANLALYTPNIDSIVDNGLDDAYYSILTQAATIPDRVISASLLTLANITQEFVPHICARFQPILEPLIAAGKSESRQDPVLIGLLLDSLGSLCRLPENASALAECEGIQYVLQAILDWGSFATDVLKGGLSAISQICKTTENIEVILSYDGLTLITTILNGEYFDENVADNNKFEIITLAFRCLRKLIAGYQWPETFTTYCQAGGITTWVWWLEQLSQMTDPPSGVITEALSVGAGLVSTLGPQDVELHHPLYTLIHADQPLATDRPGKGTYKALDVQEAPNFIDSMGLSDIYTLGTVMNSIVICAEIEGSRQNQRAYTPGLYLLLMFLEYIPYVAGASESFQGGDQQYVLDSIDKNLSALAESISENSNCPEETWEMFCQIICNTAFTWESGAFATQFALQRDLGKSLTKVIGQQAKLLRKGLEKFQVTVWKPAANGSSREAAQPYVQMHPDASRLTGWPSEAYPNGVQDLAFKDELRKGGQCELLEDGKTKVSAYWRSNQTLRQLQWRKAMAGDEAAGAAQHSDAPPQKVRKRDLLKQMIGRASGNLIGGGGGGGSGVKAANLDLNTIEFTSQMAAGRVRFAKGGETDTFKAYGVGGVSGLSADKCLSILGPPSADSPAGEELSLIFSSKKERDYIFMMFSEWKQALASQ